MDEYERSEEDKKRLKLEIRKELEHLLKCDEEGSMTHNAVKKSIEELRIKVELFKKHDMI